MKTKNFKSTCLACVASVIFILSMSSCAVKTHFLTSEIVPAAQGIVIVKTDKNDNYVIAVKISNLSPSNRLTPPREAYVVWMIKNDNSVLNLGQLNSSDNFMSNNLDASFETVSSSRPSKIVVTAENQADIQYPSFSELILTTSQIELKK
jgi:hypothetical protein